MTFLNELQDLINTHSAETESGTPDFILAKYLDSCLIAYNVAVQDREKWYGRTADGAWTRDLREPIDGFRDTCRCCGREIEFIDKGHPGMKVPSSGWYHLSHLTDGHVAVPGGTT